MAFMDEHYLLDNSPAIELYEAVRNLPIVDAHNHGDIVEIVENEGWSDIWEVQGATDHYVWELMRKRGVPEAQVTGNASNREKWTALAQIMPELIGNPVYEWLHLDLKRRFGIDTIVSGESAAEIWSETQRQLQRSDLRPQELLAEMGVEIMCTTDNPTMDLPYHERAAEEVEETQIFPTWRPDACMNVEKDGWGEEIERLGEETGTDTSTLQGTLDALQATHDYFDSLGCAATDHGVQQPYAHYVPEQRAAAIHEKAFAGDELTLEEIRDYHAYLLVQFGRMNAETDWVTQLHIGAVRNYRDVLFEYLGPDTGGDLSTQNIEFLNNLRYFLNEFDEELQIVLYCVDPTHWPTLATLARAWPNVSLGAPWWWNDSPFGMEMFLKYAGTVDVLNNLTGMVTDSRKLLSFGSRTEMYRRVLCNVIGGMIERGQIPEAPAVSLVKSLSYDRPKTLFFQRTEAVATV